MHVRMYLSMYVMMYLRVYVCMDVHVCIVVYSFGLGHTDAHP